VAFRRRISVARKRERYEWVGTTFVTPTVIAANVNGSFHVLTNAVLEEFPRALLVHVVASIFVSPATAPVAATGYGVFLGLTKAQAGAVTSVYDPETEPDHRWSWWNACFPQVGGTGVADQNAARWAGYFRFDIDRRMKERFAPDEVLEFQVKNSNSSGASIQTSMSFRFLLATGAK